MNDTDEMIKRKIDFFLKNKIKVHISKINKTFLNGYILKKKDDNVYLFKDNKYGELDLFVFEVFDISNFTNGENGEKR